jgi:alkylation response protein AidB-like acyl-CoA dehydrogenase
VLRGSSGGVTTAPHPVGTVMLRVDDGVGFWCLHNELECDAKAAVVLESAFNEVFVHDVRVPDSNRLGEVNDRWRNR